MNVCQMFKISSHALKIKLTKGMIIKEWYEISGCLLIYVYVRTRQREECMRA